MSKMSKQLTIVVLGASGDLAKKKLYPALFSLYYQKYLAVDNIQIVGYSRTNISNKKFHEHIMEKLTCRTINPDNCQKSLASFLNRCSYVSGQYDKNDDFEKLNQHLLQLEKDKPSNRLFYFSIPSTIFLSCGKMISKICQTTQGWNRIIMEKPFGRDLATAKELSHNIAKYFAEEQIYRIDHYLGKEIVQNLMVLRFANLIFEPIWNRDNIENVKIIWQEKIGTQGRGGYFDQFGIIRDVMQNHLLQIFSLIAMELPVSLKAEDIVNEKVKLLKQSLPAKLANTLLGQYIKNEKEEGYRDDPTVSNDSRTETYALVKLFVNNKRWAGVPFYLESGKAMPESKAEIIINFKNTPGNIFQKSTESNSSHPTTAENNQLVIRIQPDEQIYFSINNKIPGLDLKTKKTVLNLLYKDSYHNTDIPEAYERLILEVIRGDKSLFIRNDELQLQWKIFTPLLEEIAAKKIVPKEYAFGTHPFNAS